MHCINSVGSVRLSKRTTVLFPMMFRLAVLTDGRCSSVAVRRIRNRVVFHKMCIINVKYEENICFLKYNQRDVTLYNVLYCCQCSRCFEQLFRSSSGAQKLYMQHRYLSDLCRVTASLVEFQLNQASGNTTQV